MEVNIDQWVNDIYSKGHKYRCERHAEEVQKICQEALENEHIQHVISWRAKSEDSLRAKLKKMKKAHKLKWTHETILDRVFDIAGVRIAYYLPTEKDLITHIIEQRCGFRIVSRDTKVFGDSSSSRGDSPSIQAEMMKPTYRATHWIVHHPDEKKYPLPVEVQVMSVLASSWAQIQHDYNYKPLSADISPAERYILDEFGHSVAVSERFLDQLGQLRKQREEETFKDTYHLGAFLFQWWRKNHDKDVEDLGSLSALLRLLKKTEETRANLNTRRQLFNFLRDHVTPLSVDDVKAQYPDIEVLPAVSIMHFIIKNREDLLAALEEGHRDELVCRDKLEIIMNTILWLSEFFPSADWEKPFSLEGDRGDQGFKQLFWLTSAHLGQLLTHPDDFKDSDDRNAVNELWKWFMSHENPPVRLAWSISNAGIRRDAAKEIKRFHRVFMALGKIIRADRNYQPL
ncbi:hypothetical protein BDV06DRAFT_224618 [Aspergillus oleicola]